MHTTHRLKAGGGARLIAIALLGLLLQGCDPVSLTMFGTASGVGASTGVNHTLGGIAYKTFTADIGDVATATRTAARRMSLKVRSDKKTKEGRAFVMIAKDRTIKVELESLTRTLTRMRTVADEGEWFLKDRATSTEFIVQTAEALDAQLTRKAKLARNGRR